ncbi:hypothetical protein MBLNU230_g4592t1 [Neophaeotheca triangularis]
MPLTVLKDADVSRILHSLTQDDVLKLQSTFADALHWYSTSADANDCCSDYQPERTVLERKDGSTSIFMPASGMSGQGVKVVNAAAPSGTTNKASQPSHIGSDKTEGDTKVSVDNLAPNRPLPKADSTIKGSLTLLDAAGNTTGLLNAEEITAFRTALASSLLFAKREKVHDVTVFGGGKQAYWHIRLALLLKGSDIHHLNIVTRNFETARACFMRLNNPQPDDPDFDNHVGHDKLQRNILTPSHKEYDRILKDYIRASNVIFGTTPSTTPHFPASYLLNPGGRKKGRYIALIGSYKPHMVELDPAVLKDAVAPHHEHRHLHKRQQEGGCVVVDNIAGCMKEAGEIIQAGLSAEQVVELGELFMLKKQAEERNKESGVQLQDSGEKEKDRSLRDWLVKGNVLFKCVGFGLMDVLVGAELVELARQRKIGVTIDDF